MKSHAGMKLFQVRYKRSGWSVRERTITIWGRNIRDAMTRLYDRGFRNENGSRFRVSRRVCCKGPAPYRAKYFAVVY